MIYGLKTKDGKKLYAVGSWENNQHKIYNDYTKALNELDDAYESGDDKRIERAEAWRDRAELEMEWVDNVMEDGLIYAPWEVRSLIKDVCAAYDVHSDLTKKGETL